MSIRRPRSAAHFSSSRGGEALEVRVLPSVTATLSRGTLTLQGDQSANDVRIEQSGSDLVITGNTGTLIRFNGQSSPTLTLAGVQNIRGYFGQAADVIRFEDGLVLNNVTLNLGGGANDVEFRDVTVNGLVNITGGNNGDKVEFDAATLNAIKLNLVNGNDDVEFHGAIVNGAVSINTGNGIDSVKCDLGTGGIANSFHGAVTIKTGNQQDSIELRDATFAALTIDAGADQDEIELETVTVTGKLSVNGGAGNDEITLDEVIQTGTGINQIIGLSGQDDVKLKGATFASGVVIDMGSGPMNELEIDDVEFQLTTVIVSLGPNDQLRIEQDLAEAGETSFVGTLAIQMGPGSSIGLGTNDASSWTESSAGVSIRGTKPNLIATVVQLRTSFAVLPVLKNAEFLLV
ncbi:MAG TPA: hypothetical protein VM452_13695 [Caulifigura sp.]|nr:hypothetical protein [Caulifigura sp.]